jgi:single-stranded-DNA-specific exonuclease
VDCGTTAAIQLAELVEHIPSIVVIDHHSAPGEGPPDMPDGVILVNAAIQPDQHIRQTYGIASAGVLVYLAVLHTIRFWRALPSPSLPVPDDGIVKAALRDCLALAALTAITDMVPLRGINRAVLKLGLPMAACLTGIQAMAQSFPKPLSLERVLPTDVGFRYGPVLNAAGRIADGQLALRLMRSKSLPEAIVLANQAIEINSARREITGEVTDACLESIENTDADADCGVMVINPEFHQGVVGLAASRLLERTGRPSIVVGVNGSGSGRSIPGFHIGNFIGEQVANGLLLKGGGHAGAGGFTLNPEHAVEFRAAFQAASAGLVRAMRPADLVVDGRTPIEFSEICARLSPFGMDNPDLIVEFIDPDLTRQRWFGKPDKIHMGWQIAMHGTMLDCVLFSASEKEWLGLAPEEVFTPGSVRRIRGQIRYDYDNYYERMRPQLMVEMVERRAA